MALLKRGHLNYWSRGLEAEAEEEAPRGGAEQIRSRGSGEDSAWWIGRQVMALVCEISWRMIFDELFS